MRKLGRFCKRLDKICVDLNIILLIFAIGLATLDTTVFLVHTFTIEITRLKAEAKANRVKEVHSAFQTQVVN